MDLEDKLVSLYHFGLLTYSYPEYKGVYELMVTGFGIKYDLPRKYILDTLYYMYKSNGSKPIMEVK